MKFKGAVSMRDSDKVKKQQEVQRQDDRLMLIDVVNVLVLIWFVLYININVVNILWGIALNEVGAWRESKTCGISVL